MSVLGMWLYVFVWLPYTLLTIFYGLSSPWYRSSIGRSLFLSKLALTLILSFVLSVLVFGRYPGYLAVRTSTLALVGCAAWYQFSVFVRVQHAAHCNPPHPRRRSTDL